MKIKRKTLRKIGIITLILSGICGFLTSGGIGDTVLNAAATLSGYMIGTVVIALSYFTIHGFAARIFERELDEDTVEAGYKPGVGLHVGFLNTLPSDSSKFTDMIDGKKSAK